MFPQKEKNFFSVSSVTALARLVTYIVVLCLPVVLITPSNCNEGDEKESCVDEHAQKMKNDCQLKQTGR